jgi:flagellar biosynthesis/type III secretory pathway protein FliH
VEYQAGYAEAFPRGRAAGVPVGTTAGYNAGYSAGDAAGFADGSDILYNQCFDAAYPSAYSSAYASAYNAAYVTGHGDGYNDAFDAAYATGFDTGYDIGYANTYAPAFNGDYSAAYSSYYTVGWGDGYDDGYYDGYEDAVYDSCDGVTSTALTMQRPRILNARALREVVAPAPSSIPSPTVGSAKAKTARFGKRIKSKGSIGGYGKSFRLERMTYVPSKLPEILEARWSAEQKSELSAIRDAKKAGSLRSFLRAKTRMESKVRK